MLNDLQYEKAVEEYMEIAAILEVPAVRGFLGVDVVQPHRMPETEQDIDNLVQAGIFDQPKIHYFAPCRSWTRNAYNLYTYTLCGVNATGIGTFGDGHINTKDQMDVIRGSPSTCEYVEEVYAAYGVDYTWGIRIGTGSTGESFEDTKMDARIPHGDGAGEMRYWADRDGLLSWNGGTRKWTAKLQRYFTNHSGGSISVAEIALFGYFDKGFACMVTRDVLGSPVAVAEHELIRVNITQESVAFPS